MMPRESPDLSYASVEPPTQRGYYQLITDHWWECDPDRGPLVFRRASPQCNSSEVIARSLLERLYPWGEVRFYPAVWMKIDPHDYA